MFIVSFALSSKFYFFNSLLKCEKLLSCHPNCLKRNFLVVLFPVFMLEFLLGFWKRTLETDHIVHILVNMVLTLFLDGREKKQ